MIRKITTLACTLVFASASWIAVSPNAHSAGGCDDPRSWAEVPGNGTIIIYPSVYCFTGKYSSIGLVTRLSVDNKLRSTSTWQTGRTTGGRTYSGYGVSAPNPLGTQKFCVQMIVNWVITIPASRDSISCYYR